LWRFRLPATFWPASRSWNLDYWSLLSSAVGLARSTVFSRDDFFIPFVILVVVVVVVFFVVLFFLGLLFFFRICRL